MTATHRNIINIFLLLVLAFFSFLMLRIIALYIPVQNDAGFLLLKQDYINVTAWRVAFFIHVFSSILAMAAGFTQFSGFILKKYPQLHRRFGYGYVINILLVTGPAGLLMSFYANGGFISRSGFILLSFFWIMSTALALYKVVKKDFTAHRIWMIRSFALTLSAVTLRIWKVLFAQFSHFTPAERYRIIAWLGWVLNLVVAELIILYWVKKRDR